MEIGIDLDDTLIHHEGQDWSIINGCVSSLRDLQSRGYVLHIITARHNTIGNRMVIQEVDDILQSYGVIISTITYTGGTPKGTFARRRGCKYMIDDNPGYLGDCLDNGVVPVHLVMYSKGPSLPGFVVAETWETVSDILPTDPLYS